MLRFAVIVCVGLLAANCLAQTQLPEAFRAEMNRARVMGPRVSASGQFSANDSVETMWRPLKLDPAFETNFVHLDASLLAMSCDRIKAAMLDQMRGTDGWRGRVFLYLHHAQALDEPLVIKPTFSGRDWTYYVYMPDVVERSRLVSAIVGVTLLEIANREARERSAEIPSWLTQGLTWEIMTRNPDALVFDHPTQTINGVQLRKLLVPDTIRQDPLQLAHDVLQMRPPLTVAELSWADASIEETDSYRASAQLLVHELLRLPDGPHCLRVTVGSLGRHLNWQTSFLDGFNGRFGSALEFEKWWAVCVVNFTGRDLSRQWPASESWRKLDEIVRTTAEVRTNADDLPAATQVKLQDIVREWEYDVQAPALKTKIRELAFIRAWMAQDYIYLADDYRMVLQNYVNKRDKPGFFGRRKVRQVLGLDAVAQETIRQLDALDARRAAMRPEAPPASNVAAALPTGR